MKMAHPELMSVLEWDALHPGSLIIEHPQTYLRFVCDLTEQENGGDGEIVFSEKGQILSVQKSVLLIRDLWSVDVNQKKLLNGVYGELKRIAWEEYEAEVQTLLRGISSLIGNLSYDSMLPLTWEEQPDITVLFKAMDLKLDTAAAVFERLLDYVWLAQAYLHIKLVVLVGIRVFLAETEFEALCRDFAGREIPVLFVDGVDFPMVQGEKRLLIDLDRCELLLP